MQKRTAENELRARDFEAQARLIEARIRLAKVQSQWREYLASSTIERP